MRAVLAALALAVLALPAGGMMAAAPARAQSISSLTDYLTRDTTAKAPPPALTAPPPVLRYGADVGRGAPYIFRDPAAPARIVGFEVDLMAQLGARLSRLPVLVQSEAETLRPSLVSGLYELAVGGLDVAAPGQAGVEFTIPYYATFGQIVIRRDQPAINRIDALKGMTIGVLKGSRLRDTLAAVPDVVLRVFDTAPEAYAALKAGSLEAVVTDYPVALYHAQHDPAVMFTGPPVGRIEYGLALKAGAQPALLGALNTAIYAMSRDGTLRELLDRWELWTPVMAQETGDTRPLQAQPTAREYVLALTMPDGIVPRLERYVRFLPQFVRAALTTLEVAVLGLLLALAAGALLAVLHARGGRLLRGATGAYVDVIGGTPLLVLLLFVCYGLPEAGLPIGPFLAGVLALGLHHAAGMAEAYRTRLAVVTRTQMEAAVSLNMSRGQAFKAVVLPQAVRALLPSTARGFVLVLKDSSLVSVILLADLTRTYESVASVHQDFLGIGLLVAAIYLVLGLPFARLAAWAERVAEETLPPVRG
ncbi:ABC transporter substrate-binding protein/permease [Azorhizobium caulinodans]|nr:ABC transporter substrate-binding protein/permease [Azorhizobium caulinodans]